jgi:hypothetical protein
MFDTLQDGLREALTKRLDPGLATELAAALEALEEYDQRQHEEHPAPVEPPTAASSVEALLASAGIEPPAMHFGGSRVPAADAPATVCPPPQTGPNPSRPGTGRAVAGLSAKLNEDGSVRVMGKDPAGRAVARTVETILAAAMRREIGSISADLLDLAIKVEMLERYNEELRERLATLS